MNASKAARSYGYTVAKNQCQNARKITMFRAPAASQQMSHATFMQPLQCVVQHHLAKSHVWTHMAVEHGNNHAAIAQRSATTDSKTSDNYATARCRTPCRNQKHQKERAHPHPMHTQAAFHRRLQPLYPKKTKYFFARGFQCSIHVAITMWFGTSRGKIACMRAHGSLQLRTHEQPQVAELHGGTTSLSHHFPQSPLP